MSKIARAQVGVGNSTNPSLCEEGQEGIRDRALGKPRPDDQDGTGGVQGIRFDKHGHYGFV